MADANSKLENFEQTVRDYESALAVKPGDSGTLIINLEVKDALRQAKRALQVSKQKNYYKILNLERSATDSEIKKAYRKLALIYHPGSL